MEYMDLYDQNKKLTGEFIERSNRHDIPEGRFVNIILIIIENSKNEFLIQKTSKEKNSEYATTGGHVKKGNTNIETVIEEVNEELGLNITEKDFSLYETFKMHNKVFFDVYYMKKDIDIEELIIQESEVESVEWMTKDKILSLIKNNNFRKSNIKPFNDILNDNI